MAMARCSNGWRAALRWTLLLWVVVTCVPAAAHTHKTLDSFFRETWTTRDGLPHNQVHAVAQTPDGYLWFGTWEGLVRYNGMEFTVYNRAAVPELRDNGVRSISVARDGSLVAGTSRGGVAILRYGVWRNVGQAQGLPQDEVMDALIDAGGRLWVATESAGVSRIDASGARQFRIEHGLPGDATFDILEDAQGAIWVGTSDGLARLVGDELRAYGRGDGLPGGTVFAIEESGDGGLYVGTEHGVYYGIDQRFSPLSAALPNDTIVSLHRDADGELWVGSVNHGLLRLGRHGVETMDSRRGLPNNRVAALFIDRESSIWAGTGAGLMRLRDAPFSNIGRDQGLSDEYVRTVLAARDGFLWIGTSRGLNRWDGQSMRSYTLADGLPGDSILSLLEDDDGQLWIGTYADGLLRLRDGIIENVLSRESGLPGNQVRALARTADGSLWVGTTRGLVRWRGDGSEVERYGLEHGLPREYILSLHAAEDGGLWVGTAHGVAKLHEGRFEAIDISHLDAAQDVFGFHEAADGSMWMATDRGLLRWKDGALSQVGIRQGLPVETLFQLVEDGEGYFWLSSNRGVMRVKRSDAEAAATNGNLRIEFETFGEADGMASSQCNGGSGPSAMRAPDGSIWFATARGAAQMRPGRLTQYRRTPPPVVIESVRIDDQPATALSSLQMPPGARKLEIHYAGLSFQLARQIRYRYRLDGFDHDWVERGQQRSAQFTNLAPGRYVFRVSAANPGAVWQAQEAVLEIHVLPHWWQRGSVQAVALLLVLAGVWSLWRLRSHRALLRERELRVMVEQRTADLRIQTERLLRSDQEKSRLLDQLREQSEAFERQAHEDSLTGVGNRRSMDERLVQALAASARSGRPLSFALLDIDHFKRVNDDYSHAAGDAALRAVAQMVRAQLRADESVARWGGEEFAILMPDADREAARICCERIRKAVEGMDCEGFAPGLKLTASLGIALRDDETTQPERLVSRADQKLYEAKHAGRNRVCG
ncbi:MAG TPA: two-component regulator propeller domain-containing protein [Arenimonas sp.]|nr:two-component regulator propeller domain-containing protein [Arenimonas sp.]